MISAVVADSAAPGAASSAEAISASPSCEFFGERFVLIRSSRAHGVDTEEYVPAPDKPERWSRLVCCQRLSSREPVSAEAFATGLRHRLESAGAKVRFRFLQRGKAASIFAVHHAAQEGREEQVSLALVTTQAVSAGTEVRVVQGVLRPARMSLEEMELLVQRWQSRFQAQAAAYSTAP